MSSTTGDDSQFVFGILIFYFIYLLFLNVFSFIAGVPSFFDLSPSGNPVKIMDVIGSLTLGNFSGIPVALNLLLGIIGFSFVFFPSVMFIYNKIRGV